MSLMGGIIPATGAPWRNGNKTTPYSQFREMCQALSFLLLILNSVYFISNLNLAAGEQIFASSAEQPVLLLIPDFTFCSVYTKLDPMEVVRLFETNCYSETRCCWIFLFIPQMVSVLAWFPEGITRADKCFLRCMLRKWGLFVDGIGRTWNVPKVSKYLFSIGTEWRRKVEASSAVYFCKQLHKNMTTKYGCKNAFNFFYCLYNHGMSFLLTEKDISDYRKVYEAMHPYPVGSRDDSYGEEESVETRTSTARTVILVGEDYDAPVTQWNSSSTLTTSQSDDHLTELNGQDKIEPLPSIEDLGDSKQQNDSGAIGPSATTIRTNLINHTNIAGKNATGNVSSNAVVGGFFSTHPRLELSNHSLEGNNTQIGDVLGDNHINSPSRDTTTNHATVSEKPVNTYVTTSRSSFSGKRQGTSSSSSLDRRKVRTTLTSSEKTKHWSDGVQTTQNTTYNHSNNTRFTSAGDEAGSSNVTEPKTYTIPTNLMPPRKMNISENNSTISNDLISRENGSLQEASRNSSTADRERRKTDRFRIRRSGFLNSDRDNVAVIGNDAVPISLDNSRQLAAYNYRSRGIRNEFRETDSQGKWPVTA